MINSKSSLLLVGLIVLVCLAQPTLAFGAGNIGPLSKIEGVNWRHGDIEDVLLNIAMAKSMKGKKFSKINVSRIYFGNWLRDYSQAVDVATVQKVSAEAIRLIVSILGFLSFGYGSQEFEVTAERLGCYRPEEHIDNPKNYADNEDARQYDRRLRGPIDERRELSIDPNSGMKNYIANEQARITTSAQLLRQLFGRCIDLGRKYGRDKKDEDLYDSLILLGTGLHCLEDFFAHSNYAELALIEMGERDVFPHCGRNTQIKLEGARGPVYPITTGTFGGVDFLHSVTGAVSDKMKQNELDELEDALEQSKRYDTSKLRSLLDMIPDSFFGGEHQSDKVDEIQNNSANSQMQNMTVKPKKPEELTRQAEGIYENIMPIIKWHDNLLKTLTAAVDKIPVLPKIIEQLEEQITRFIYTQLAPFILPIIQQIQVEMQSGSEGLIKSSKEEQHIVFDDDRSTDPTHSMLSKDHFTNLLNEPCGRTAGEMVKWAVPQIMAVIDDERADVDRTLTRIIYGVLHHPAQRHMGQDGIQEGRQLIFNNFEKWWKNMDRRQQDDYRRRLTREGVKKKENHKGDEFDTGHGHGCLGELHMHKQFGSNEPQGWEDKIAGKAAGAIVDGATGAVSGMVPQDGGSSGGKSDDKDSKGGLLGAASSLFGGVFGKDKDNKESSSDGRSDGRSDYQASSGGGYGGPQESSSYGGRQETSVPGSIGGGGYGGRRDGDSGRTAGGGYSGGSSGGGGYSGGTSAAYGSSGGGYSGRQESSSYGGRGDSSYGHTGTSAGTSAAYGSSGGGYSGQQESSSYGGRGNSSYGQSGGGGSGGYGGRQESSSYGGRRDGDSGRTTGGGYSGGSSGTSAAYGSSGGGYSGRQESSSYGARDNSSYGRSTGGPGGGGYGGSGGGYGGRQEPSYGGSGSGRGPGGRSGGYGGGQGQSYGRSGGYSGGGSGGGGGYGSSTGGSGSRRDDRYGGGRRY